MNRSLMTLGALALAATTSTAFAQQGGQPPQPPARGLDMALALEATQAAVSTCLSQGVKGAAAVLDSAGVLRVLVSADGASPNGRAMAETGFVQGGSVRYRHGGSIIRRILPRHLEEKFSGNDKYPTGNDKYRTGSLVACERKVAFERR